MVQATGLPEARTAAFLRRRATRLSKKPVAGASSLVPGNAQRQAKMRNSATQIPRVFTKMRNSLPQGYGRSPDRATHEAPYCGFPLNSSKKRNSTPKKRNSSRCRATRHPRGDGKFAVTVNTRGFSSPAPPWTGLQVLAYQVVKERSPTHSVACPPPNIGPRRLVADSVQKVTRQQRRY
jgi:hypothetical protein